MPGAGCAAVWIDRVLVADMDLDQQEKKLTSGVEKALEAWANADEDKKPMYREAWQTEVAML